MQQIVRERLNAEIENERAVLVAAGAAVEGKTHAIGSRLISFAARLQRTFQFATG